MFNEIDNTEENTIIDNTSSDKSDKKVKKKNDECLELKTIKYKSMLLTGNAIDKVNPTEKSLFNLDKFLEDDKQISRKEPWSKLDKTMKTKKIMDFVASYSTEKKLKKEQKEALEAFLKDCLNRKRLQRVKDVDYDKENGVIKSIPSLVFNKTSKQKQFTLKNVEKRVSTLKSLPQNRRKTLTAKNKKGEEKTSGSGSD
jgi:hypothetical protein